MVKSDLLFVIATKNQGNTIERNVSLCLKQTFKGKINVLLVDDKSTDGSDKIAIKLAKKNKNVEFVNTQGRGRVKGLNKAIKKANSKYLCLSAGDIFYKKDFVKTILSYFNNKSIAFVSPFSDTGGNATVWQTKIIQDLNGFDEDFNEKGTGFRDDTDLAFRAFDKGYKSVFTYKTAKFEHEHKLNIPTLKNKLKYGWSRLKIHRFDPLLYKKHPTRGIDFFDIKLGFIRNPKKDFAVATGLWKGNFDLSSPQGVVLVKGDTFVKKILIVLMGLAYVIAIKSVRLYGSIKYKKLLI
jgi:glycosyltransferase involved in cell wall biosynthesis